MKNINFSMDKQDNITIVNYHSIDFITQVINVITYLRCVVWPNTRNL